MEKLKTIPETENKGDKEIENVLIPVTALNLPFATGTEDKYVDISDYLNMPQTQAAKRLQLPTSTLSRKWREAALRRKWPFRAVRKVDKEITALLHNVPQGDDATPLPQHLEMALGILLRKRKELLRPVVIRM